MATEEDLVLDIIDIFNRAQEQVLLASKLRESHSQAGMQLLYQLLRHHSLVLAQKCERTHQLLDSLIAKALTKETDEVK